MHFYFNVELYIFLKFVQNWQGNIPPNEVNYRFVLNDIKKISTMFLDERQKYRYWKYKYKYLEDINANLEL